jgi:hypothetical protein
MDFPRLPSPWPGFTIVDERPDRVSLDGPDRIRIEAECDEWHGRRPKAFVFGLNSRLTVYEFVRALDERHPYSGLGDGAEDEGRGDIRRAAISLSGRCQKFFDTIIRAYRAERLKSVPTSWSKEADETRLVFKVPCALEVILDELPDELAALGDGRVIGALRAQRDSAKAEREAKAAAGYAAPRANSSRKRGEYAGLLEEWMLEKSLLWLRRMGPKGVFIAFKDYCEQNRPDLLPLLPKRLRPPKKIEGHIHRRATEAERAKQSRQRAVKSQ